MSSTHERGLARRFISKAGISLLLRLSWAVLNFLGILLLARWFSAEDYGTFAIIISIVTFLGILTNLGSQTTLMRFLGQYKTTGENGLIHGITHYASGLVMKVSLAIMFLAIAGVWLGATIGMINSPVSYTLGLLLLPGFALVDTQSGIARSYGSVFVALAPRDVLWRAGVIGLGYMATLSFIPVDIRLDVFLFAASALLVLLVFWQVRSTRKLLPAAVRDSPAILAQAEWHRTAFPIWISAIAAVSLRTVDVLVLGFMLEQAEIGYYFAASRTAALTGFVLLSVNLVTGPHISHAFHAGRYSRLRKLLRVSALLAFLPALALFGVFALYGDWILAIFGPNFVSFWPVLMILSGGHVASSFFGSTGLLLDMTGHEKANTYILLTTSLISTAGMALGGVVFGSIGAAVAAALGLAVWNARQWAYAKRTIGFDPSIISFFESNWRRSG